MESHTTAKYFLMSGFEDQSLY